MNKVIKFGAEWCSACKAMDKIFSNESINWHYIDVDEHPESTVKYEVNKLPTLLFIDSNTNEVKHRHIGSITHEMYNEYLNG